jgi:hypothetical protein
MSGFSHHIVLFLQWLLVNLSGVLTILQMAVNFVIPCTQVSPNRLMKVGRVFDSEFPLVSLIVFGTLRGWMDE